MKTTGWIARLPARVALLVVVLAASHALARVGGGEHYNSGREDSGDDGGAFSLIFQLLFQLVFRYPVIGIPLLIAAVIAYFYFKSRAGSESTRKALDSAASDRRTNVASRDVDRWVVALKAKDPAFDLISFLDRTRGLFLDVQEAWFMRVLDPVRRFLSDATYTRLAIQLKLLAAQGVRDAIADVQVVDLKIIGLEQSPAFDTVHVRVKAQLRDDDAVASASDDEARALAKRRPLEPFTEVWSFVRKPGAVTQTTQGTCPNCGAPFAGGASNQCEFCKAIVNSGNYDWVLSEVTQGSEYSGPEQQQAVPGFAQLHQRDPALSLEVLEDRASLTFWKWVDAQSSADAGRLAKIADPAFVAQVKREAEALAATNRRKIFLECSVGAVNTLSVTTDEVTGRDLAHLEVRWSARTGTGPVGAKAPNVPSVPQRSVFTLQRSASAATPAANGLATSRCPTCGAPLSDNASVSCEFCGTLLASGERDWVIRDVSSWENWRSATPSGARENVQRVDQEERQRLLYLMAAMAAADGEVDSKERALLKMTAERWSVPFSNVELAMNAGPGLFDRLIAKGSSEAENFMSELVNFAMIDGRIDRKERQMLERAAQHLGLADRLDAMIAQHPGTGGKV